MVSLAVSLLVDVFSSGAGAQCNFYFLKWLASVSRGTTEMAYNRGQCTSDPNSLPPPQNRLLQRTGSTQNLANPAYNHATTPLNLWGCSQRRKHWYQSMALWLTRLLAKPKPLNPKP